MPKPLRIFALCVWPGLPQIWLGEELLGLALAFAFAAALNLAILANVVRPGVFAPAYASTLVQCAEAGWVISVGYTLMSLWRRRPSRRRRAAAALYRQAADAYLAGRYDEAKLQLERLLKMDESDADALMQLGTMLARTGRPAEARVAFCRCLELEGGARWRWEIDQEISRLRAA